MTRLFIHVIALLLSSSTPLHAAKPLAQKYVVVHRVRDLKDPQALAARGFHGNPGNTRRILMLNFSVDGLNWFQAGCVAMSKNPLESFHYSSQVVVGDDLLVLSRSSIGGDTGYRDYTWRTKDTKGKAKLAYNNHDSNMITLHRVRNFRSLALDLNPDFSYSSARGRLSLGGVLMRAALLVGIVDHPGTTTRNTTAVRWPFRGPDRHRSLATRFCSVTLCVFPCKTLV